MIFFSFEFLKIQLHLSFLTFVFYKFLFQLSYFVLFLNID